LPKHRDGSDPISAGMGLFVRASIACRKVVFMSNLPRPTSLPPRLLRLVGVRADCDPRTVRKYLAGRNVYSTYAERIERALRDEAEALRAWMPQTPDAA
jgi:hypothetical protein